MNRKIFINTIKYCWLVLCLFQLNTVVAQTTSNTMSVLKMLGTSGHKSYLDTNIKLKSMLLDQGTIGQGTIEFWAKFQNNNQILNLTTDAVANKNFKLQFQRNNVTLTNAELNLSFAINNTTLPAGAFWQHFAIVLSPSGITNKYNIDLYIDGVKVNTFNNLEIATDNHIYFAKNSATDEILLTEIRAWNLGKTGNQLALNRYTSYYNKTGAAVTDLIAQGLVANYSGTAVNYPTASVYLPELNFLQWKNTIQATDFPLFAKIVTKVENESINKVLSEIKTDLANPIDELSTVIVTTSKGEYNNKINVAWYHINGATNYNVYRDNIKIATITPTGLVGSIQSFTDSNDAILPGTIYTYKVEANDATTTKAIGSNNGFIFPNGTVTGTVKTQSEVNVANAGIEIGLSNTTTPTNGNSLLFTSGSKKITILENQIFTQKNNVTIEFWYKNTTTTAGNNTVFKLANTEIVMSPSTATINWSTNSISKSFAIGTPDINWHHYAFALGTNGVEVVKDGITIGTTTDSYAWVTAAPDMNAYLNYNNQTEYSLDEFRVWNGKKSVTEIKKFGNYIADADETDLLLAYSMDLNSTTEIYNHALTSRGSYIGKTEGVLTYSTQPSALKYVTYTDTNGNYSFSSIYSNASNGNSYTAKAFKPNHEFRPATVGVTIKSSTIVTDYTKIADFIDISELPVSGNIYYVENNEKYPVPSGKKIAIDGNPVLGIAEGLESNIDGVYSVSSALGLHTIEVYNPEISQNKTINSIQFSPSIAQGKATSNGYAVSKQTINYSNNGITISGFVKPFSSVELPNYQPEKQTLVDWGNFEIVLANNVTIQLWYNNLLQKEISIANNNDFNFFGISIEPNGNYAFLVGDNYKSGLLSNVSFSNELLYLGASVNGSTIATKNCVSQISLLQIRNKSYDEAKLRAIKNGNYILNDDAALDFSFEMEQEKGSRLLSKTSLGKTNYLTLQELAKIDTVNFLNYTQKLKYNYAAINPIYNPAAGSANYTLNVEDPLTSVNFEMKDRYGFIGNIVIPCDNNLGTWKGKITRVDGPASPKFEKIITANEFDLDNKIFKIDGLIPGNYQVILTNVTDSSITLTSPIIDLTKGWKAYDFEYRSGLFVDINIYNIKTEKLSTALKDLKKEDFITLDKVCNNDFYVTTEGNTTVVQANVYEKYGDQKCVVSGAKVNFAGDMLKMPNDAYIESTTDSEGRAVLITYAGLPNFISPYLRNFTIQATHNNRNKIVTIKALIQGAKMNQSDFTIDDPVVNVVLHDPPGDGSNATLKAGHKTNTTGKWKTSFGYASNLNNKLGVTFKQDLIATVMGIGTSISSTSADVLSGIDHTFKISGSYNGSTAVETETFTDISTATTENLVGKKADLFIGTGYLITVGTGETLSYDNCTISHNTSAQVVDNKVQNAFVHSYYDIQKNMIPNLLTAYTQETNQNQKQSYENSIKRWTEVLVRNDQALNDYKKSDYDYMKNYDFLLAKYNELPETLDTSTYNWGNYPDFNEKFLSNRSFDGGGSTTTLSLLKTDILTNGADFETSFDFGYKTIVKGKLGAAVSEFEYKNSVNLGLGGGFNITTNDYELMQLKLTDNDAGDRFAIQIKKDPQFETPIFKTIAGKSSCPAEKGTQLRNALEIVADGPVIASGLNTEVLKYKIKLRNTQNATNQDAPKTYKLSVPVASNPYGASVTVNGSSANGALFTFDPDPNSPTGVKQEITANVEIKMGTNDNRTDAEYKDIQLVFSVPCEDHSDIGFTHNTDVYEASNLKSVDYLYLTAQFHGPCIANLGMQTPQANWVVNADSQNKQNFVFTIPGTTVENNVVKLPESLTAINIEYALKENNTAQLLRTINTDELKQIYSENAFRIAVDVSSLANGEYGFRLVPICGLGTESWRKNTPTAYAYGQISRIAPQLLSTNPVDGGILQAGSIMATYNKALNPNTLNSLNIALRGTLGGLPKKLISVDFKNKDNQITIPHAEFLNLNSAYTLEFWVNPSSYPLSQPTNLISKGNNYGLWLTTNGKLNYSNGNALATTSKAIPLFEWTHITVVYDGVNTLNFYYNGELTQSITNYNALNFPIATNTTNLTIGGMQNNEGFLGQIDEIRIWDNVRTPAQIVTYKNRQLLGNESGLKAYYTLDNNALIVDGFQEAVRDYTGNTKGSTSQGISWIEGDMAAPLAIEQLVQDIPVTISTNIDKNQIIITPLNFQEYFLEGAKLTAVISANKVKGVDGNSVAGTSWSFTINKNNVVWAKANINASQSMGQSINIDALIKNNGGSNAKIELQSLPEWLKCTNASIATATDLNAGFEKKLTFATSAYLNKGVYNANIGVITYNEAGEKTGYEYFALELTVNCQAPDYSFNNATYALTKEFTGQLTIDGQASIDSNDMVVAYFNNEIRGKANVSKINNKWVVSLSVFYNEGEQGALTFRVWDDSHCKEYVGLTQEYFIDDANSQGTLSQPVPFVTGNVITKRIPLLAGFQWVTFNVTNQSSNSLSIVSVKGMNQGDEITELGTTKKATFDANGNATGTLTTLDFKKAYLVYATTNKLMQVQGVDAAIKTDIAITGNYTNNYVGYIPNVMFSTSYALRSLSNKFTIGDRISGREGFAEFTDEGWKGTLTHLIANKAYRINMTNSGTLNYSGYITTNNLSKIIAIDTNKDILNEPQEQPSYLQLASQKGIVINSHKYAQTMAITATIEGFYEDPNNEYLLVAQANGEYRGIAKPVIKSGKTVYFMTIYGNNNENIQFQLITNDEVYKINEKLMLNAESFVGNYQKAYELHIQTSEKANNQLFTIDKNPVTDTATISIHPLQTDVYELNLYNLSGSKIATLFTGRIDKNMLQTITLDRKDNNLPSGVYLCKLTASGLNEVLKIIVK